MTSENGVLARGSVFYTHLFKPKTQNLLILMISFEMTYENGVLARGSVFFSHARFFLLPLPSRPPPLPTSAVLLLSHLFPAFLFSLSFLLSGKWSRARPRGTVPSGTYIPAPLQKLPEEPR